MVPSRLHATLTAAGAVVVIAAGVQLAGQTAESPAAAISFNRDVRPIMSGTCFRCHGPDESSRRAGMRLDLRDEALKRRGNGTPIVPGKPDESLIVTTHLRRGSGARDAAGRHPQGADRRAEADHPPMD